jgi:hypothetical protein
LLFSPALASDLSDKNMNCKTIKDRQAMISSLSNYFITSNPETELILESCLASNTLSPKATKQEYDKYFKECIRNECHSYYKNPEKFKKICQDGRDKYFYCRHARVEDKSKNPDSCLENGKSFLDISIENAELNILSGKLSCRDK